MEYVQLCLLAAYTWLSWTLVFEQRLAFGDDEAPFSAEDVEQKALLSSNEDVELKVPSSNKHVEQKPWL